MENETDVTVTRGSIRCGNGVEADKAGLMRPPPDADMPEESNPDSRALEQ
jgi:hypothetical protein